MTNKEFKKMYPNANMNDFARHLTLMEGLKKSISNAQMKEVIHYVALELFKYRQWRVTFGRYACLRITKTRSTPRRGKAKGKRK